MIKIPDTYIDFIFDYFKGGIEYPMKNKGFNLSFVKLKNKYIFVVRNVFPFKILLQKKELIPGISRKKYSYIKNKINVTNAFISENFIWDWNNFYESNILFLGNIDENLNIIPDININPYSIINPRYNIKYVKNNENQYIPARIPSEDFRLYNFNNKIYMIDSAINVIRQIYIKNNTINVFIKYQDICNIKLSINKQLMNIDYHKIFEKNWSLYKVIVKDNKEQSFLFFHDFSIDGIETVEYNPITKKCKKKIIIKYPKNTFPNDNKYFRYSFGSSCIYVKNTEKSGYLGVGHFKNELYENDNSTKDNSKYKDYYVEIYSFLHKKLKSIFKNKYKPHFSRQYYLFYFMYDDIRNKFYISNFYLPISNYDYIFSLFFPISINRIDQKDVIISGGYGDYVNMLIKMPLNEVLNSLEYDVTTLDISKIKLKLLT